VYLAKLPKLLSEKGGKIAAPVKERVMAAGADGKEKRTLSLPKEGQVAKNYLGGMW